MWTSGWKRNCSAAALFAVLVLLQLAVAEHPRPVHPDEDEFISAIGFPKPYPVHHPGYPLWSALGTILHGCGLNPYLSYQIWSMLAAAAGPTILFLWLCGKVSRGAAWWTGLALGVCPLWWFHGATALNYSVANAIAIGIVAMCGAGGRTVPAAVLLAIGIGVRPDMGMWLAPLVAWSAWRSDRRQDAARVIVVLAMGAAAWAGLSAWLYRGQGGPELGHTLSVLRSTSVLERGLVDGVLRNGTKLGAYLGWGLGLGLPVLVVALAAGLRSASSHMRRGHDAPLTGERGSLNNRQFFALWLGPVLAFQLLVHVTEAGHALWYLPALYAAMAIALSQAWPRRATWVLACLALSSAAQFWCYPWHSDVTGRRRVVNAKVAFMSREGLMKIAERERIHRPNDFWKLK